MTFNAGDIVQITGPAYMGEWIGLEARVVDTGWGNSTRIELTESRRPDGYGTEPFMWNTDELAAVTADEETPPAPVIRITGVNGFGVGDRVVLVAPDWSYNTHVGMVGTVSRLNDYDGGRVPSFAVKFDDLDSGGYYSDGEFVVTPNEGFGSFVALSEYTPAPEQLPEAHVFAVGDRVRVLEAEGVHADIGQIGIIVQLRDTSPRYDVYNTPHPYRVRMETRYQTGYRRDTWDVARVELVGAASPAEPRGPHRSGFAVGDFVQLTRSWSGLAADSTGVVTRLDDYDDFDDGANFGVKFDGVYDGGYYGGGEYLVESHVFSRFVPSDGRGRIAAGDEVVLKSIADYSDNDKPAITNYMTWGTVYTVREIGDDGWVRLDGVDGGWLLGRFKRAPAEVVAEPVS